MGKLVEGATVDERIKAASSCFSMAASKLRVMSIGVNDIGTAEDIRHI